MSTKIYNGLILRNASLEQALAKLKAIRAECVVSGVLAIATLIAERIAFKADMAVNYCSVPKSEGERPYMIAQSDFFAAKAEVLGKGIRNVTWDFTFEVAVIPHGTDVLAMFYIEADLGYTQALIDAGFEDYHYQNSADRPAPISEPEWDARFNAWDTVLPGRTAPCEVGFAYDVVSWNDLREGFFCMDRIKACTPDAKKRAGAVAIELAGLELNHDPAAQDLHKRMRWFQLAKMVDSNAAERAGDVLLSECVFEV